MSDRARNAFVLALVTALVLVSLLITVGIPGVVKAQKTHLGLDLQGGTELIFQARTTSGLPVDSTTLADTINIMRSRADQIGVSGIDIRPYGRNQITASLPNVQDPAKAESVVGVTGQLYFYDWENSVIGPNGQVAGPNDSNVTGGVNGAGTPAFGISEYDAVMRAAKRPAVPTCAAASTGGIGDVLRDRVGTQRGLLLRQRQAEDGARRPRAAAVPAPGGSHAEEGEAPGERAAGVRQAGNRARAGNQRARGAGAERLLRAQGRRAADRQGHLEPAGHDRSDAGRGRQLRLQEQRRECLPGGHGEARVARPEQLARPAARRTSSTSR